MTDLITEVYSTLAYILEEIANNVNNISPKYLPALVSNVSPTLLFYIGISLVIFIVCIYPERKSVKTKPPLRKKQKDEKPTTTGFDIAPDDDVIFKSLVSKQEADAETAKNSSKHIPMKLDTKVRYLKKLRILYYILGRDKTSMFLSPVFKNLIFLCSF